MEIKTLPDTEIFEGATTIWENMIKGSNTVDYEVFSKFFGQNLKKLVTKERFESQCKEHSLLTSLGDAIPVACIHKKEVVTVLFRQFSTTLDGEFIGQLTLSGTKDKYEVINAQVY